MVEVDQWDREYLDLVESASIRFGQDISGELAFRGRDSGSNSTTRSGFIFEGSDEGDEVSGSESAEPPRTARSRSRSRSTTAMTLSSERSESELFNSLQEL
jgi:hypothetical protein